MDAHPILAEAGWQRFVGAGQGGRSIAGVEIAVEEPACDELHALVPRPGIASETAERLARLQGLPLGQDRTSLLDHDPAVERMLELGDPLFRGCERAFIGDADRCDVRQRTGHRRIVLAEGVNSPAEDVQGPEVLVADAQGPFRV